MKRKTQRLSLSRETLKRVETQSLREIEGAAPTLAVPTCVNGTCAGRCLTTFCA
ncbi:MAG TPA: hypothetical protein VN783_06205 [Thermoanaerobaculia bacterium]|nr:hypothetical protein [Thermoanaerobaculia bacterium]